MRRLKSLLSKWLPDASRRAISRVGATEGSDGEIRDNIEQKIVNDLRRVGSRRGTNLLGRAAEACKTRTPELLAETHEANDEKRSNRLFDTAHNLKSSGASIGAVQSSILCAELEQASGAKTLDRVPTLSLSIEKLLPQADQELTTTTQTTSETSTISKTSGQNILVVDDDASFRRILRDALAGEGFIVTEAENADEAIATAHRKLPDLVLVDAIMDGMDGFEVCHYFTNSPELADVPVVMVTGLDDVQSMNRALRAGASGFVTKPIDDQILIQQLHFVLHASELKAESEEKQARLEAAQRLARIGYWTWNVSDGRFEMSAVLADLLDVELESFGHDLESYLELVHVDDRQRVRTELETSMADRSSPAIEYRMLGGHGVSIVVRQDLAIRSRSAGADFLFGTVQDITCQLQTENQIRKLAYFDNLTGLASRSFLMLHLGDAIRFAARRNESFALLCLDLDEFKDINDSLGHDIGDRLLQIIACRLRDVLREGDFIARLGGDEFCMIVMSLPDQFIMAEVAQRCLDAVGEPVELMARRLQPQVSIGIAHYPHDGEKAHLLVKAADSAMYAAKKAGKNRYAFYSPEMTMEAEARLTMDSALRLAFEKDEFVLHYQPQISLSTGRVTGVEALVRWQHPEQGLISPKEFIPAIERIGLIKDLGNFVIKSACAQLREWHLANLPPVCVSVNVSPMHFGDPTIADTVRLALQENFLKAGDLELEITETVMQNELQARQVMEQLTRLGVKIAIDDFGTGYSSLGSLKHLPIHRLKIDRLFVRDMLRNTEDATLIGAIVGLAHTLGYTVVAEGVEELTQLQVLAGINCDVVQGFYFSKPVAASEIPALLRRSFLPAKDHRDHANSIENTGIA